MQKDSTSRGSPRYEASGDVAASNKTRTIAEEAADGDRDGNRDDKDAARSIGYHRLSSIGQSQLKGTNFIDRCRR